MPRRYRRDGGDGSSQYETTSQHSHSHSGGLMESLSIWSAQFTNLSSVTHSVDGGERDRLTNRTLAMLLGRRAKDSGKDTVNAVDINVDMDELPTHHHHHDDVDVEGGEERVHDVEGEIDRVEHHEMMDDVEGGVAMIHVNNTASKDG